MSACPRPTSAVSGSARGPGPSEAVARLEADANRSADTHLHAFPLPDRVGHRPLPQGRVGPSDGLAQASARPLAVSLRPVQRLDHRADDDRRGLERLDRRLRGVLRAVPGAAVRRRHAGVHEPREDRADRGAGRVVPPRRRPDDDVRRGAAAGGRARRLLPRPVHLRRARDRLARQQQHRRVDLHPDGAGAASRAGVDRGRRRHGRNERDDRPLRALRCGTRRCMCVVDPEDSIFYSALDGRPVDVHRAGRRGSRGSGGSGSSRHSCRTSSTG